MFRFSVSLGVPRQCPRQCPRQDSNLRTRFRKPMLYPLSYGSFAAWLHRDSNLLIGLRSGNTANQWYRLTRVEHE
jgi:hypothetical protein